MNETICGLHLCDDLIFTSRVNGTAKSLGLRMRSVRTAGDLTRLAQETPPCCVIMDLHVPGLAIEDVVRELGALDRKPFIVGYGSHVDTATLKRARDAGCDIVWPRSKFVEDLSAALPTWFQPRETPA